MDIREWKELGNKRKSRRKLKKILQQNLLATLSHLHSLNRCIYALSSLTLLFVRLKRFPIIPLILLSPRIRVFFPPRLFLGLSFESSTFMVSLFLSESKSSPPPPSLYSDRVQKHSAPARRSGDFWSEYLFNFRENSSVESWLSCPVVAPSTSESERVIVSR